MEGPAVHLPVHLPGAIRAPTASPTLSRSSSLEDEPQCRICWGPGSQDDALVSPCGCLGTAKNVHYRCLVRWVATCVASGRGNPSKCDLCQRDFFGTGSQRHTLLLATSIVECKLARLYQLSQALSDAEQEPAGARRLWERARRLVAAAQQAYWRLALRPVQGAMLLHQLSLLAHKGRGRGAQATVVLEGSMQMVSWWAGATLGQLLPLVLRIHPPLLGLLWVANFSLSCAQGAGEGVAKWMEGCAPEGALFFLRLPIGTPFFTAWATALAALGALAPGRLKCADGMRAAAALPCRAAHWALSQAGRQQLGQWAAGLWAMLARAAAQLRAALLGAGAAGLG